MLTLLATNFVYTFLSDYTNVLTKNIFSHDSKDIFFGKLWLIGCEKSPYGYSECTR